jgi:hypothetical protein
MIRHKLPNKTKSGTVTESKPFHQLNNPGRHANAGTRPDGTLCAATLPGCGLGLHHVSLIGGTKQNTDPRVSAGCAGSPPVVRLPGTHSHVTGYGSPRRPEAAFPLPGACRTYSDNDWWGRILRGPQISGVIVASDAALACTEEVESTVGVSA